MKRACSYGVLAVAVLLLSSAAQADVIYNFDRITDNYETDLGSQLQLRLHAPDAAHVSFEFKNLAAAYVDSCITNVFFDDSDAVPILSSPVITNAATVDLFNPGYLAELPGREELSPIFDEDFKFGASAPLTSYGVHPYGTPDNDLVTITFEGVYGSVLAGLGTADLRIAIHVQGLKYSTGVTTNDSYIVPEPTLVSFIGLGVLALVARRRK